MEGHRGRPWGVEGRSRACDVDSIADTSRNPFMRATSGLIEAALSIALRLSSPADNPELITDLAKSHRRIVDAIATGDEEGARRSMREVIELGATRTQQALGKE